MTSFAFVVGVVPLVIAQGAGSEMRRTLGTAVFAGMLGVTLFGIFLTPVFFYVIRWLGDRLTTNQEAPADEPEEPPGRSLNVGQAASLPFLAVPGQAAKARTACDAGVFVCTRPVDRNGKLAACPTFARGACG